MKKTILKICEYVRDVRTIYSFCLQLTIKSSPKYFSFSVVLNAILVVVPFATIYATSKIMNILANAIVMSEFRSEQISLFIQYTILSLLLILLQKTLDTVKQYCEGMHREIMQKHVKFIIMDKASKLDLSYFDTSSFYNEMNDVSLNSPLIIMTAMQAIDLIKNFIQLIIAVTYLVMYNYIFAILLIISVIPNLIFKKKQLDTIYSFQRSNFESERKMYYSASLVFSQSHIKDVKLYNLFPFISQKFQCAWDILFNKKRKLSFKYVKLLIVSALFPEIVTTAIIFMLGLGVINGVNTMGDYSYYQGIVSQVLVAMYMIVYNYGQFMDQKMRIGNFLKFLKWENPMKYSGKLKCQEAEFTIEFRNVSFKYDESLPYILKDVNFIINSQEKVAFVGSNGCGKSTIIKLIMRYYDPSEGIVFLNGIDIRSYDIENYRRCFSTLFQDYCNYAFTVGESISLSDYAQANNIEKIQSALTKGGANVFVSKFENGIDTYLTRQYDEHGEELSGGQWQKIASSRTFFRDAAVYILDEPSSSLDAEAEDELFKQIDELCLNKTAILVSHRLSNITSVDNIFLLEDGMILESGTHNELIRQKGRYEYLYKLQSEKYKVMNGED